MTPTPRPAQAGEPPRRVVLDTNVSLALFLWEDPACAALSAEIQSQRLQPILDLPCLDEWQRVLASLSDLTVERRARATSFYHRHLELVATPGLTLTLPRCRDPDDQKFLHLAAGAGASALYTRDQDLLRLHGQARRRLALQIVHPEDCRAESA